MRPADLSRTCMQHLKLPGSSMKIIHNFYSTEWCLCILLGAMLSGCATLPLPEDLTVKKDTAGLIICTEYTGTRSDWFSSKATFYFKHLETGDVYEPDAEDEAGNVYYLNLPTGEYTVDRIKIYTGGEFSIVFDRENNKVIKKVDKLPVPIRPSLGTGISISFVIPIGPQKLEYQDVFSRVFTLRENRFYHVGEYEVNGTNDSFNDLPNFRILHLQKDHFVGKERLASARQYIRKIHRTGIKLVKLAEIFQVPEIDLSSNNEQEEGMEDEEE